MMRERKLKDLKTNPEVESLTFKLLGNSVNHPTEELDGEFETPVKA